MAKKRSEKKHRPKIERETVRGASNEVLRRLINRLEIDKGWGSWLSRHEILGFLEEETYEVKRAVHNGTMDDVAGELIDVAAGCIFALACIRAGTLDW